MRATTCDPAALHGTWLVLQVQTARERRVASYLEELGIEAYLPVYKRVANYETWTYRRDVPIFPGYVFACIAFAIDLFSVRRYRYVQHLIDVHDQQRLTRELADIRRASELGKLKPYGRPVVGQRVEVTDGPFKGMRGRIERVAKRRVFVLGISLLGQGSELEIDHSLLAPVND